MWLKKAVGITLVITIFSLFVITIGGIGFTRTDRIRVQAPDGSIVEVTPEELAQDPTLVEIDTAGGQTSQPTASTSQQTVTSTSSDSSAASTTDQPKPTSSTGNSTTPSSSGSTTPSSGATVSKPVITMSINPGSINVGSSSTLNWSASNSPTSCTASGSWSGTKSSSGSQSTGTKSSAGTFTYSLSCSNSAGSASASINQTVSSAPVTYCGGLSPCKGVSDMASHASSGNCWARTRYRVGGNYDRVYSLNGLASAGHKTNSNIGLYNKCGQDMTSCLNGGSSCGSNTHNHSLGDLNKSSYNGSQSFMGYYDPAKP